MTENVNPIEALPPAVNLVFGATFDCMIEIAAKLPEGGVQSDHVQQLCEQLADLIVIQKPMDRGDALVKAFLAIQYAVNLKAMQWQPQDSRTANG